MIITHNSNSIQYCYTQSQITLLGTRLTLKMFVVQGSESSITVPTPSPLFLSQYALLLWQYTTTLMMLHLGTMDKSFLWLSCQCVLQNGCLYLVTWQNSCDYGKIMTYQNRSLHAFFYNNMKVWSMFFLLEQKIKLHPLLQASGVPVLSPTLSGMGWCFWARGLTAVWGRWSPPTLRGACGTLGCTLLSIVILLLCTSVQFWAVSKNALLGHEYIISL